MAEIQLCLRTTGVKNGPMSCLYSNERKNEVLIYHYRTYNILALIRKYIQLKNDKLCFSLSASAANYICYIDKLHKFTFYILCYETMLRFIFLLYNICVIL